MRRFGRNICSGMELYFFCGIILLVIVKNPGLDRQNAKIPSVESERMVYLSDALPNNVVVTLAYDDLGWNHTISKYEKSE